MIAPPVLEYDINLQNVAGELGFQLFLSGGAEEPLFRGFVMVLLGQSWQRILRYKSFELPVAGLLATFLFMLAHVELNFETLTISGFYWPQQFKTFCLGIFWAMIFHRTKSLLFPIVAHGFVNASYFLMLYCYILLLG